MCILQPGTHPNRLDGLQSTSRTKQLTESAVQSIMPVLQTNVTSHGMQGPDTISPCSQRLKSNGCCNGGVSKYVAYAHFMRCGRMWRPCSYGIAVNHSFAPVKDSACTRNSSVAGRSCLSLFTPHYRTGNSPADSQGIGHLYSKLSFMRRAEL
jgi:hypothetical protein